jgi:hypothetical protein
MVASRNIKHKRSLAFLGFANIAITSLYEGFVVIVPQFVAWRNLSLARYADQPNERKDRIKR